MHFWRSWANEHVELWLNFFFSPSPVSGSPANPEDSLSVRGGAPPSGRGRTIGSDCSRVVHSATALFFTLTSSLQGEDVAEVQPVFATCLLAELVPASVQDYREKLLHLRKLRHDLVQRTLPQGPSDIFQQVWREHFSRSFTAFMSHLQFHFCFLIPIFSSVQWPHFQKGSFYQSISFYLFYCTINSFYYLTETPWMINFTVNSYNF